MKYFPYEHFYINTSLAPDELYQRLVKEIKPPSPFSFKQLFQPNTNHYFTGYAWPDQFRLTPQVQGRNSFVPEITGKISRNLNGTRVEVFMRLQSEVFAFMCIWLSFAGLAFVAILYQIICSNEPASIVLVPLLMISFAYGLATMGFKGESCGARDKLVSMFDGELEMIK